MQKVYFGPRSKLCVSLEAIAFRPNLMCLSTWNISKGVDGLLGKKLIRCANRAIKHRLVVILLLNEPLLQLLGLLVVRCDDGVLLELVEIVTHGWRPLFHSRSLGPILGSQILFKLQCLLQDRIEVIGIDSALIADTAVVVGGIQILLALAPGRIGWTLVSELLNYLYFWVPVPLRDPRSIGAHHEVSDLLRKLINLFISSIHRILLPNDGQLRLNIISWRLDLPLATHALLFRPQICILVDHNLLSKIDIKSSLLWVFICLVILVYLVTATAGLRRVIIWGRWVLFSFVFDTWFWLILIRILLRSCFRFVYGFLLSRRRVHRKVMLMSVFAFLLMLMIAFPDLGNVIVINNFDVSLGLGHAVQEGALLLFRYDDINWAPRLIDLVSVGLVMGSLRQIPGRVTVTIISPGSLHFAKIKPY